MDRLPFAPSPLTSTWAAVAIVFFALPTAWGQEDGEKPKEVVLERTALKIKDPQEYHVRMQLRPTREVTIAAPARGVVQLVPVKTGQSVRSQGELVRLKSEERLLEQKIASAEFKAAQIAHDKASGDDKTILAAKLDAAKARL
ncbi:MAG: hypothetical protein KDA80_18910, partial [Planctomycetaceae bacterium]|nr:hypothetical protein [Planctomycetaceae bacterium]